MNVVIDINGDVYRLPLDGTPQRDKQGRQLRCIGIDDGSGQTAPRDLATARYRRVLERVPRAPDFVTVQALSEMLQDMSSDTIRRMLHRAQHAGEVTSITPKNDRPGNVTRHWMIL